MSTSRTAGTSTASAATSSVDAVARRERRAGDRVDRRFGLGGCTIGDGGYGLRVLSERVHEFSFSKFGGAGDSALRSESLQLGELQAAEGGAVGRGRGIVDVSHG